jgi:ubiquinone/menaquinone biosynthesis C-methylase UbiE
MAPMSIPAERTKSPRRGGYVPALRFHALTRFYDRFLAVTMREEQLRRLLVAQARIQPGHRVLDVGCGTGTLAVLIKQIVPDAEVVGLDIDPEVLALARNKARAAGVEIHFVEGLAYDPPLEEGSFDRIVSTLVFHHLTTADKRKTLERARALLRPGGEIHIGDWGAPQNAAMHAVSWIVRVLDGLETTSANFKGMLPSLMREAGFADVVETRRDMTAFGTFAMLRGVAA